MSIWMAMLIGACIGVVLTTLILSNSRNGRIKAEYEQYIAEIELSHQQALLQAQKRSVNTSRAVLKGKMAEQLAPIMPEFQYLPSDAKFLGDPVDYIVFDGYTDYRDGNGHAEDIAIVLIDIKSGGARLTKGQQAIAQAIQQADCVLKPFGLILRIVIKEVYVLAPITCAVQDLECLQYQYIGLHPIQNQFRVGQFQCHGLSDSHLQLSFELV